MSINRWKLNKAGILNYWYYDEKVFNFADGRMLLRGSNGSGKSVTMQSLITILLDGNTRASRLDSFGSTARRIDDYLLGEKEISETDERTGYLYLEYKRENSDQYITTGIGLHAVRNSTTPIGFWGFILKDKRINKDVKLYKTVKDADGRAGKAIYNRRELTDAIGSNGIVVTSRDEYARLVNRNIFGFSDEKYAELVTLLIQLRSPKLSRDFKPTVVYDILNNSLPAIPEEELRPLTETLDNIRNIRAKKERLKKELAIFERLCRLYENANRAAIFEKYNKYVEADRSLRASRNNLNEVKSLLVQAELDKAVVERQYSDLRVEEKALKAEQEELQRNDIYHAIEEKEKIENDLKELRSELDKKEKDLDDKHKKEIQYKSQIVEQDNVIYKYEKNGDEIKDEMNYLAAECDFAANEDMMNSFKWNVSDDFFATWEGMISNYKKKLQEVRDILREYDEYNSKYENMRSDYGEMSRQQDELNQNLADSEKELENEKEQIIKSLYEWENKYSDCLEISADQHSSMIENIRNLYENEISWNNVLAYLDKMYNDAQQKINRKIADIEHRIEICSQELKRLNDELQILLSKKEIEPALPEEVILSRKKMKNAGISFIPFYEAVEYRPGLSDAIKERIESVLLSSGILQGIILQDNKSVKLLCQGFCDAVINSSNKQISGATLSNYLVSSDNESGISKERIIAILSSISIDEQALINRNMDISKVDIKAGIYHTGTIYGKAPMRDKAIYIGKKSREEFRIRQIHMLEEAISALEELPV